MSDYLRGGSKHRRKRHKDRPPGCECRLCASYVCVKCGCESVLGVEIGSGSLLTHCPDKRLTKSTKAAIADGNVFDLYLMDLLLRRDPDRFREERLRRQRNCRKTG